MVGQHIGKYRVTQQIGRGGMGTVYAAIDETLHREVAIKALSAGLNDPTVGKRFRAEAVTIARLNHPGIATIYELVQHDGQWLMVMEYVRGDTLERVVNEQGALPVDQASDLVMQMLAALAHAHGLGVVHRDLKPANLMLTAGGRIKITDFGIARVAGAEQLTTAGFMMGTPAYMAPEQVLGQDIDARTDLYAIGLVFYHLVTATLPFTGTTPIQVAQARVHDTPTPIRTARANLPEWIGQVVDVALAKDPSGRFQTALLFREAIRRGLSNLPIEASAPAALPPELVVTAAPGSLRVPSPEPPLPKPKPTSPPAAAMPTIATLSAGPGPARKPIGRAASSAAFRGRGLIAVVVGAVVLVGGVAVWLGLRSSGDAPAATPSSVSEATDAGASNTGSGDAGETALESEAPATIPDPAAAHADSGSAPPAASQEASVRAAPAATLQKPDGPASTSTPTAAGRTAGRGAVASSPIESEAPAARASAAPVSFRGVRGFVVTGRRVDERPAVLNFADGKITMTDENGQTQYGALPYAEVTSAAYTRGRNPRWYPTLAGPPPDVDMPGGLFRGDRYWLALQSRVGYLIVRMNDNDWRRILAAVTEHVGRDVSQITQ